MSQVNILKMLQNDHRKVTKLFKELEMTTARSPSRRQENFNELDEALSTHADFEEQHVYPLLLGKKTSKSTVLEALEEHLQLKCLLTELRQLDPQDERWMAKAQVLMEDVRHHVAEEESEVFPQLRKGVGAKTLQRLAQDYQYLLEQSQLEDAAAMSSKKSVQTSASRSASPNTMPQLAKQRQSKANDRNAKISRNAKKESKLVYASDEIDVEPDSAFGKNIPD